MRNLRNFLTFIFGIVFVFTLSASLAFCEAKEQKSEELKMDDPLQQLKEAGAIWTDTAFIRLLEAQGLNSNMQAPARLRSFLAALSIAKMSMGVGYLYKIRRSAFIWSTGDCYMPGYREQIWQKILVTAKNSGLSESEGVKKTADVIVYTLEEGGLIHTVAISKPSETTVNGRAYSSSRIVWKLENSNPSSISTLSHFLSIFPFMKDKRIEDSVYAEIGPLEIEMVTMGGADLHSYDWDVTINPAEKMKKGELYVKIRTMIENLGYVLEGLDKNVEIYHRKSTNSHAYIDVVAGTDQVHIRFLPEK